ncbi:hypothetical protein FB451DRAFT_1188353 [Mycena latifolia]|nr:hypothetical protein FB451DRAFT_1188353 [Mycena latifolia]
MPTVPSQVGRHAVILIGPCSCFAGTGSGEQYVQQRRTRWVRCFLEVTKGHEIVGTGPTDPPIRIGPSTKLRSISHVIPKRAPWDIAKVDIPTKPITKPSILNPQRRARLADSTSKERRASYWRS